MWATQDFNAFEVGDLEGRAGRARNVNPVGVDPDSRILGDLRIDDAHAADVKTQGGVAGREGLNLQ